MFSRFKLNSLILAILPILLAGCSTGGLFGHKSNRAIELIRAHSTESAQAIPSTAIALVQHSESPGDQPDTPRPGGAEENTTPFTNSALTSDELLQAVSARNPTISQMTAAAALAAARYPQVTSLDDPVLGVSTAPGSFGSSHVDFASRVEVSQKFPLFGKRNLRGQIASAEANAAMQDLDEAKLLLAEATLTAFADYYLSVKAIAVSEENRKLIGEMRQNAETRYKNGVAPQQDMLQADVEMARLDERLVSLKRACQIARARINTLAHLPVDSPLPPPDGLRTLPPLEDPAVLRVRALANRPELKALSDRLAADESALNLAQKEYKPDVELLTAYDGFWQGEEGRPLQWQVGARVNLPWRLARRDGAVMEAKAKVSQRRAELARLKDQIRLQVQEAFEQAQENEKVYALYETKLLPAAQANAKEAQAAYVNGKVPFLSLVEAQRNVIAIRDRYYEVQAELFRRRATLERVLGDAAIR